MTSDEGWGGQERVCVCLSVWVCRDDRECPMVLGRHCVRSILKKTTTTTATTTITAATINTNCNKKQFSPKRCGAGESQHWQTVALKSITMLKGVFFLFFFSPVSWMQRVPVVTDSSKTTGIHHVWDPNPTPVFSKFTWTAKVRNCGSCTPIHVFLLNKGTVYAAFLNPAHTW